MSETIPPKVRQANLFSVPGTLMVSPDRRFKSLAEAMPADNTSPDRRFKSGGGSGRTKSNDGRRAFRPDVVVQAGTPDMPEGPFDEEGIMSEVIEYPAPDLDFSSHPETL